jgi:hypothetical protein
MTMTQLISFLVTSGPTVYQDVLNILVALGALLVAVHVLLVFLENFFPNLKREDGWVQTLILEIDKWTHGSGAWNNPAPAKPAVTIAAGGTISKV